MELIDQKIRRKVEPERWPLPGLAMPDHSQTDFSQLVHCPEFVPRQASEKQSGRSAPEPWREDRVGPKTAPGARELFR